MMTHLIHSRRRLLRLGLVGTVVPFVFVLGGLRAAEQPAVTVYRNPGCGCCHKWAAGLEAAGFAVTVIDEADLTTRRSNAGVPPELAGCHTALLGDYVIEGHVPTADIVRLLEERPKARGLAVAGMPMGSPGMETEGQKDAYDVMLFTADGKSEVYARH